MPLAPPEPEPAGGDILPGPGCPPFESPWFIIESEELRVGSRKSYEEMSKAGRIQVNCQVSDRTRVSYSVRLEGSLVYSEFPAGNDINDWLKSGSH